MTIYGGSAWPGTLSPLTWGGIKTGMRANTGIMIAAIITGGLVALATVGAVVLLVINGKDTVALLTLVNTIMLALGFKQVSDAKAAVSVTSAKVDRVAEQTNGTQARLMDAALRTAANDGGR